MSSDTKDSKGTSDQGDTIKQIGGGEKKKTAVMSRNII